MSISGRFVRLSLVVIVAGMLVPSLVAFVPEPTHEAPEADAVVVLGGGDGERVEVGVRLWRAGRAPLLVLSAGAQEQAAELGVECDQRTVLCLDPDPVSTAGEAETIATMSDEHGWEVIAVVTSGYHVRRARLLFKRCVEAELRMVGAPRGIGLWEVYHTAREGPALVRALAPPRTC